MFASTLRRLYGVAALFYALLTFIILYPLAFHNGSYVAGYDYYSTNWSLWWIRHALTTPGLNVYVTNFLMAPHVNNLGYHALGVIWYPLWALLEPLTGTLTAVNVITALACFLNGYLFFIFLLDEGVAPALALLGGAVLQLCPTVRYFFYNTHTNLMPWFWLPVHLLLWKRIAQAAEKHQMRRAVILALIMGLAIWGLGLSDQQFPIFLAFVIIPYGLLTLWRSTRRVSLIAAGVVAVVIGGALLWIAGPLPYMLHFAGTLAPGRVEDRPGIPFPLGFLTLSGGWWNWDTPSLGGFVAISVVLSLVVSFWRKNRSIPWAEATGLNIQSPSGAKYQESQTLSDGKAPLSAQRRGAGGEVKPTDFPYLDTNGQVTDLPLQRSPLGLGGEVNPASRWLWFAALIPPLILSMGPTFTLGTLSIPMPYRWLYDITAGNFRMPWRLAPVYVFAAMIFVCQTWSPLLSRVRHVTLPRARTSLRRAMIFAVVFLLLAADIHLFQTGPVSPVLPPYQFYSQIGQEKGSAYDNEVVLEVPTGAGSGETLIGDPRVIAFEYYGMTHGKRMVNGFISRAPLENYWPLRTDDPLLSWLGQRRLLDPKLVEPELRQIIHDWPLGYIVVHQDYIGTPTNEEIIGYFNSLPDLLCPVWIERDAVVFRSTAHPDGCPARTPTEVTPGVYQIDLGSSGDERFIGWGWHGPESVGGLTVRWAGQYPQANLYVDLPPQAYHLEISAQAFNHARNMEVLVNGTSVGTAQVPLDSLKTLAFDVPAAVIGSGKHITVTLAYDGVDVPAQLGTGSADQRKLSVMVDWLRFSRP